MDVLFEGEADILLLCENIPGRSLTDLDKLQANEEERAINVVSVVPLIFLQKKHY